MLQKLPIFLLKQPKKTLPVKKRFQAADRFFC